MAPILLADGDRNFGRALAIALRLDGQVVMVVSTTDEALNKLECEQFQIAIVDCLLPNVDMLLQRLVACGIRVVATGTHPELLHSAAGRHPSILTIGKPFQASDLSALLAQ